MFQCGKGALSCQIKENNMPKSSLKKILHQGWGWGGIVRCNISILMCRNRLHLYTVKTVKIVCFFNVSECGFARNIDVYIYVYIHHD